MYLFRTNRVLEINWTRTVFNNTFNYVSKLYAYFEFLLLTPCDTEIQSVTNVKCFSSLYYIQIISEAGQFPSQHLLTFRHHASYIQDRRTATPQSIFLDIQSTNIFNYFFKLSVIIFVYYSTKVVYFLMLPFLVHKIFTFYINGVLNCKCPAPRPRG